MADSVNVYFADTDNLITIHVEPGEQLGFYGHCKCTISFDTKRLLALFMYCSFQTVSRRMVSLSVDVVKQSILHYGLIPYVPRTIAEAGELIKNYLLVIDGAMTLTGKMLRGESSGFEGIPGIQL